MIPTSERQGTARRKHPKHELGDFTTTPRVIPISLLAIVVGLVGAGLAWGLLKLIYFFTHLFFFQNVAFDMISPTKHHLGYWVVLVPAIGGLIIGLMARYGSEKIRGHGIPEAIEAILLNSSRVEPKVAILKPLSSAISIGSGGPFGAEGPIIMTGGSFGSIVAQLFHLTGAERKTLLVAGAAAGMSATFAAPISAIMLAVELLLFEWKPRSLIPVALASVTAATARFYLLGSGPLFPTGVHPSFIGPGGLLGCALVGLLAGALSSLLTIGVYAAEDTFARLPIHWMWWPAIGGLFVGLGGLAFPQALGVGYDLIGSLLLGHFTTAMVVGILVVKSLIWIIALGSGTSGGVLAPLLMMGGALGGVAGMFLPNEGAGFWPLIAMGAIMGGTMRSPFTGIIFALELTRDVNALLPLTLAVVIAEGFTVLVMKRSILTEKLSRRGRHLTREYAIDPLEIIFVHQVMKPLLNEGAPLVILPDDAAVAYPDEPLRKVVYRMAAMGQTELPVVSHETHEQLGAVTLHDLLRARERDLEEETKRVRFLNWPSRNSEVSLLDQGGTGELS